MGRLNRGIVTFLCLIVSGSASACRGVSSEAEGPPNIILFFVDDLGWSDLSCQGSDYYETPHIDSLARQGVRFTNAYANAPNCAPTRASLMTGQYSPRHGVFTVGDSWRGPVNLRRLAPPDNRTALEPEAVIIAELLSKAGYATAHIGKWHLGSPGVGGPEEQGFDRNVAGTKRGAPRTYFSPYEIETLDDGPAGEYLTDRMTQEALGFIRTHRESPFFLYMSHFAVHMPIQAPEEIAAKYEGKTPWHGQSDPVYAAMVESVDQSLGAIMAELRDLGLSRKTAVFFTSDNGGVGGYESTGLTGVRTITDNFPLKGGKGQLYEGGIRVPMLVSWPGQIEGERVCEDPVISIDLFPTYLELAGQTHDLQQPLDGVSLVSLLTKGVELEDRPLFWFFPVYLEGSSRTRLRTSPVAAVRQGNLKLLWFFEDNVLELYDLEEDVGESRNLVEKLPQNAAELHQVLKDWIQSVGAPVPPMNPNYGTGL